jgi:hypothetical protein
VKGEIGTGFIEEEATLIEDMKNILAREQVLGDKLPLKSVNKAKVAAMATSAVLTQIYRK